MFSHEEGLMMMMMKVRVLTAAAVAVVASLYLEPAA